MHIPFDNSYARLPDRFYVRLDPTPVAAPKLIRINDRLARDLGIDPDALASPDGVAVLAGNRVPQGPSRWRWPMPATSSAISSPNWATAEPICWVRSSAGTAFAATSS